LLAVKVYSVKVGLFSDLVCIWKTIKSRIKRIASCVKSQLPFFCPLILLLLSQELLFLPDSMSKEKQKKGGADYYSNSCDCLGFYMTLPECKEPRRERKLLRASQPAMQLIHEPKAAGMKVMFPPTKFPQARFEVELLYQHAFAFPAR
jgi:hypothetical protein